MVCHSTEHMPQHGRVAALRIRQVVVQPTANNQATLVGLAEVHAGAEGSHDRVHHRLQRFGNKGLQRIAGHGQAETRKARNDARMACHRHTDLFGTDVAKVRLDANHAAFRRLAETRDLAVLQDIHAERRSGARIAPSHGVVAGRAAAGLHETTEHGVTRIGCRVQQRNALLHFFACEHEGVDAVQVHGAHPAVTGFHVVARMQHVHDTALAEHDVVVQVL